MINPESEDFLLVGGSAKILDLSADGVRRLERAGVLHAKRVNGVRIFSRIEVEQLAAERARQREERSAR